MSGALARRGFLLLLVLSLAHGTVLAVQTRFWEVEGFDAMLTGESDGLSLTPEGVLLLAPDLVTLPLALPQIPPQPFLWRAVEDSKGNLYVGSGVRGLIYRISPQGEVEPFFQTAEIEVHALAVDGSDAVLVGASPPGRIYRVEPNGEAAVYFEPPERYIWDLELARDGSLFVATGEQGVLYRVSPEGEASVYFDSDESHLVSLVLDVDGMLYVGSSGSGRLYRVAPDGHVDVVLDSDGQEVARLALTSDGTVFAAVNRVVPPQPRKKDDDEPKERLAGELPGDARPAPLGLEELAGAEEQVLADGRRQAPLVLSSALYRIPAVGAAQVVWESRSVGIHSLLVDPDGRAMFGTGIPGRLYHLDSEARAPRLLARFPESQVTFLAGASDSVFYAGTSNPGRVYRSVEPHGHSGEYLSAIRDAGATARWGHVAWDATAPAGSRVEVATRSGNSSSPDNTWSDWSPAYENPRGSPVSSPPARFLQWRARLSRLGESATPELRSLTVSYQEENRRPALSELRIADANDDQGEERDEDPVERRGTAREFEISWTASDPNGDTLDFDLFRVDADGGRTELAAGWSEPSFVWDTLDTPGGTYRIEVHASDGPDNDHASALAATLTSATMVVDRTPPDLEVLSSSIEDRGARILFEVTDAVSPVVRAEYSLGTPPRRHRIAATDGLDDQKMERYELMVEDLAPGSHRIRLMAEDRQGNRAETTVTLEVAP
jgi:hypothetical protein